MFDKIALGALQGAGRLAVDAWIKAHFRNEAEQIGTLLDILAISIKKKGSWVWCEGHICVTEQRILVQALTRVPIWVKFSCDLNVSYVEYDFKRDFGLTKSDAVDLTVDNELYVILFKEKDGRERFKNALSGAISKSDPKS